MTKQTVNIPLLRKAVEWVEEQDARPDIESQWNQQFYWHSRPAVQAQTDLAACGTTYCVAGWLAMTHDPDYAATTSPRDKPHAAEFAANLLGIDDCIAGEPGGLFWDDNTADDVRRIAEDIAGERL